MPNIIQFRLYLTKLLQLKTKQFHFFVVHSVVIQCLGNDFFLLKLYLTKVSIKSCPRDCNLLNPGGCAVVCLTVVHFSV